MDPWLALEEPITTAGEIARCLRLLSASEFANEDEQAAFTLMADRLKEVHDELHSLFEGRPRSRPLMQTPLMQTRVLTSAGIVTAAELSELSEKKSEKVSEKK
ncbi:MAG: hypothetical protein LBK56_05865 [Gracilibacteraceae bacterium]|nr:hypothetical protein [Gracilibacteraceae bacterium]